MANNQMPHNLEAEAALLGCLLIDESIQSDLLEQLREDDFYQESHRLILAAMREIYYSRKTVDLVTLVDKLNALGTLDRAGGMRGVSELAEQTLSSANYKQYFEIVRRDSVNRSLIRAARDIVDNSMKSPEEREAIAFAEKQVYDLSKQEDNGRLTGFSDGDILQQVLHKFEEIQADPYAYRGVETGFRHLDRITHGLQKGSLVIIAARPGCGKTSLAMNIVEHACLVKGNVAAVFSLEMPYLEITQRLLCAHAGVSMENALSAKLTQKDWKNLLRASDKLQQSKIFIDDSSRATTADMLSKCRRLKSAVGRLDLIMVDYIQLMTGEVKGKDFNRQQEVANISRDLKLMAKELEVPVIALSQLRRYESKEAQLSDLRESGAIEQDADIVMVINRPDSASPEEMAKKNIVKGAAELNILKHRNGSTGRIQLRFIGDQTKFVDIESQNEPDEEPDRVYGELDDGDEIPLGDEE